MNSDMKNIFRRISRYLTAALLISAAGGCAYFNSYYNAKKLYDFGTRGRQGFPDTLLAAGAQAAALQQAAEKFAGVAASYPSSRWVAPSFYYMGNCFFFIGQNEKALRKYQEVWQFYGSGKYAPLARLNSAVLNYKTGDYPAALTDIQFLRARPDQQIIRRISFLEAEIAQASGDYPQAAILWQRFLFNHPKNEFTVEARLKYAQCLIAMGQHRQAVLELEILAGNRLPQKAGYQVKMLLAQSYQNTGQPEKALGVYRSLLNKTLAGTSQAALLDLLICQLQARSTDAPAAGKLYAQLAQKHPQSLAASVAYCRMGELQEAAQNLDSAKALYTLSSQGKNNDFDYPAFGDIRTLALKKMENISLLGGYRRQLDSAAAEQNAQLLFLMAEHYLFGLGQPDSAVSVYLKLASDYPSMPIAAKSLYVAAWILDKYQRDTALVRTYRLQLVEKYPFTRYANAARMEMELPPDLAVSDSEPAIEFRLKPRAVPAQPDSLAPPAELQSEPGPQNPPAPAIPGPSDDDNRIRID
ncbi:tetratricopeptide repeat protein [candidate division TA06 bacterium]|uniref:Tetratricopeptide repeat protein n=1 Tax=candidate division TA06 bacterium TaxID=2250710 RepID=A0A933MLL4_UNCT6|nr:tetratricopeptide repeat protein [candidate division TA06 bacterium]